MTVRIQLTKGYETIVDDQDADLSEFNWCAHVSTSRKPVYAKRESNGKMVLLHRIIMIRKLGHDIPHGMETDHIDGNGLNNQRDNLRLATHSQNNANSRTRNRKSCYRGVRRNGKCWLAMISTPDGRKYLGTYTTEKEAAQAYNVAAKKEFGEFARLNHID